MKKLLQLLSLLLLSTLTLQSCYRILPSKGGGQISGIPEERRLQPKDVIVPEGYIIEVVAQGLTFPTGMTFDASGTPYVVESGYAYGEVFIEPRLLRVEKNVSVTPVYTGEKNGPWNGVTYSNGHFFISEGGQLQGGKILKVSETGEAEVLVEGLPSLGDHHTNSPVVQNGYVYFGQGTATNSGVVGNDNADYGWLTRFPDFHDIPCKDIIVNAVNKETRNVLTENRNDMAVTGPFSPYNQKVEQNQVIRGGLPCSGAVMRVPENGGELELVAWGLRNPYGMAIAPNGEIFVTDNSYDVRGSRPVWGTGDLLFKLEENAWYGWPDYNGTLPVAKIKVPGEQDPVKILAEDPAKPASPVANFGVHSSSNGISFSTNEAFGFQGQAFIAQFGDMAPAVGKVISPVGFRVVRVDVNSGIVEDFAVNSLKKNAPASLLKAGGLERPISVQFDPEGNALYIVDFGILAMGEDGPHPVQNSGVIWKVTKQVP